MREDKEEDYFIVKTDKDKNKLYDFLFENIKRTNKFMSTKDYNLSLDRWLKDNFIKIPDLEKITVENVYKYLSDDENLGKCKICGKDTKFIGIRNRKIYNDTCSEECHFKLRSKLQTENNTVHRMTPETKKKWKENLSKSLKKSIADGRFTPNVTNSWCLSMIETKLKNNIISHRSSWESYFHIFNEIVGNELEYETIRIPYIYENEKHTYIVDFVDKKNKLLFEIKPNSEKTKKKNETKRKYANEWCKSNGYKYMIIADVWFKKYYDEKYILGQPNEEKLIKNLKQFKNEN